LGQGGNGAAGQAKEHDEAHHGEAGFVGALQRRVSKAQYEWLRAAIVEWRQLQATLKEMQRLSRRVLFETVPHPPRRKRLGKNVLGLM
jgi:hypothetical protein